MFEIVSTPFLPNGSRYNPNGRGNTDFDQSKFQHLFFLMEVATIERESLVSCGRMFQHLFFLMEVATGEVGRGQHEREWQVSTPFLPNGSRYSRDGSSFR